MKKYNLSGIMKRAWELVKKAGLTISEGLKKAWREAKNFKMKEKNMMRYDSKNWKKQIEVDGISFKIGYQIDKEFSGPVFEMKKNNRYYGALMVAFGCETELGFDSGIHATENEISAAKKAWTILKETELQD